MRATMNPVVGTRKQHETRYMTGVTAQKFRVKNTVINTILPALVYASTPEQPMVITSNTEQPV